MARVRGRDGYGFPKWVTGLDVGIGAGLPERQAGVDPHLVHLDR